MGRKLLIGLSAVLLLTIAGFFYLRYGTLKAKDYAPDMAKARSPLDLRPALIAKLQQLVKDGSDSLYTLSIDTLLPDIAGSTLDVKGVQLSVDSAGYKRLAALRQLPDDVYKIRFAALHVDGIGIEDLIHVKDIKVKQIAFTRPHIEAWHKEHCYNAAEREAITRRTLYQQLTKDVSTISIGHISLREADYIVHEAARKERVTTFKKVSIELGDILVDSATQYDAGRVLFAKHASLACRDYSLVTPDSLYLFKIGSLAVSAEAHTVTATNVSLEPRGGRQTFEHSIRTRRELFTLSMPRITLTGVDWLALLHGRHCVTEAAAIDGGKIGVYLDKSLPADAGSEVENFPQQLLMDMPFPVALGKLLIRNTDLAYEEYSPDAAMSGIITLDQINAHGEYISNMPERIALHPTLPFAGKALFMNSAPINAAFTFGLPGSRKGAFTADISIGAISYEQINPFAEPLGGITFKTGRLSSGETHLHGNNYRIDGDMTIRYEQLHIDPIKKKQRDNEGDFKKRHVTAFVANTLLIKKANPGRSGGLRQARISFERGHSSNFFNFTWSAIKSGILKTIGIPVSLGMKG